MNRKAEKLFDAITLLREDLVEEAQRYVFRKRRSGWRTFGSLAACMVLVVSLGLLAAMPRGCGAAGNQSNSSSAPMTPAAAPGDENMGASGGVEYGDGLLGGSSEPMPEPSAEAPPEGAEPLLLFSGQVLEILEDALLVEPFNGDLSDGDLVRVPLDGLEDLPEFRPGDVVTVLCGKIAREDGEAAAVEIEEVWQGRSESRRP